MVDGVDNISPGIGAPIANAVGPTELDIESVELIPGAALRSWVECREWHFQYEDQIPLSISGIQPVFEKQG